jgi:hypothetical protein
VAETTRHRKAFEVYWRLGTDRTIEKLRAALGAQNGRTPALRTLFDWSSKYQWQGRLARLEHEARLTEDAARIAAIAEMAQRQAKAGLFLQQKGMELLIALTTDKATLDGAVRAVVEGAKLERLARGEATERKEMTSDLDPRLESLSDEQVETLIRMAQLSVERAGEEEAG